MRYVPALRRYLLPAGFGLLGYGTLRLLNDTVSGFRFWERSWALNLLEMAVSAGLGYGLFAVCRRLLHSFHPEAGPAADHATLGRELLAVAAVTELMVNLVFTPLAALTDDGLSWADFAAINTVPLLYGLIYYGVLRSRHYLRTALSQQLQLERAAREQALSELKFLRAQYHPHFLFNALNTVYFQMDEDVAAAKRSVEQLADLLRYQLYDQQQPVPIRQELQYLRSYLELQRVRNSEKLRLHVAMAPQLREQRLYPLLLLPLLENAFKYVGGAYEIDVRATLTADTLEFRVCNSVAASPRAVRPGGIGLDNLRRRLQLLYPQRHQLQVEPQPTSFTASLTLALLPA